MDPLWLVQHPWLALVAGGAVIVGLHLAVVRLMGGAPPSDQDRPGTL